MQHIHGFEEWLSKQGMSRNRRAKMHTNIVSFNFLATYCIFRSKDMDLSKIILDHFFRTAKLEMQTYFHEGIVSRFR
jgi:hypothetical protein